MRSSLYLTKILGIEIRIHYSWFIIFLLVTFTLASYFSQSQNWALSVSILAGILTALLLFTSILFHELTHAFVGLRNKTPIKSISLFVFGGVAQMTKEPPSPAAEFKMAIAGPLFSLFLALLFWTFSKFPLGIYFPIIFFELFRINLILVLFNLVPAFPLDGGRVFRSILWSFLGDLKRATRTASRVSQFFAFLVIMTGFLFIFQQSLISGMWLIFIGWFLFQAAELSFRQVLIKGALSKIKISEIMNRGVKAISPEKNLQEAKTDFFNFQQGGFPVVEKDKVLGIITVEDIRKVLKEDLSQKKVKEVMTPASRLITIKPADNAYEALTKMTKHNIGRLPVVDEGKLLGLITRASLLFVLSLVKEGEHDLT